MFYFHLHTEFTQRKQRADDLASSSRPCLESLGPLRTSFPSSAICRYLETNGHWSLLVSRSTLTTWLLVMIVVQYISACRSHQVMHLTHKSSGARTFSPGQFPRTLPPGQFPLPTRTIPPAPLKTQLENYIYTFMYAYMHTYIHTCIYTYMHAHTYICIQYIHACIHTFMHTYTLKYSQSYILTY